MKKFLSLLLALTMTAACLVGCGGKEEPKTDAPAAEESADAKFVIGGIFDSDFVMLFIFIFNPT